MNNFGFYAIPVVIAIIIIFGLAKKVRIFDTFLQGAGEGINSTFSIAPSLIGLITAVTMLKASGALDIFTKFISPFTSMIGIPAEIMPLALLKPISGGGSLALLDNILATYGADSIIGRIASIIMGSTETTFYTIAVYFGAVKIKNSRHAVPNAIIADICAVIIAILAVKTFFG